MSRIKRIIWDFIKVNIFPKEMQKDMDDTIFLYKMVKKYGSLEKYYISEEYINS